jgi:hypothetical protein
MVYGIHATVILRMNMRLPACQKPKSSHVAPSSAQPFRGTCISQYLASNPQRVIILSSVNSRRLCARAGIGRYACATYGDGPTSRNGCYPAVGIDFYEQLNQIAFGCDDDQSFAGVFDMLATQDSSRHRTIFVLGRYSMLQTGDLNPNERRRRYLQLMGARQQLSDSQRATVFADAFADTLRRLSTFPNTTVVFVPDKSPSSTFRPNNVITTRYAHYPIVRLPVRRPKQR